MTDDIHPLTQQRTSLTRSFPAVLWGLAPVLFVGLVTSALLWGTGHDLSSADGLAGSKTALRAAVAWLAALSLLMLLAYPMLGLAVSAVRGVWSRSDRLLARLAQRAQARQRRRREFALMLGRPAALGPRQLQVLAFEAMTAAAATATDELAPGESRYSLPDETIAAGAREIAVSVSEWASASDNKPSPMDITVRLAAEALSKVQHQMSDLGGDQAPDLGDDARGPDWPRGDPGYELAHLLLRTSGVLVPAGLSLRFPLLGDVRPTALGNAEAAVGDRVRRRYALDLGLAWPRLEALIPAEERQPVASERRRMDAAVSLTAGWLVATVWLAAALIATAASGFQIPAILLAASAVGALALYTNSYRQAVDRTIAHGRLVESAVDLHRLSLLDALGWRRPETLVEERSVFAALSDALAGATVEGRFRRYSTMPGDSVTLADLHATLDDAMAEVPARLRASLEAAVEALPSRVNATVERSVTRAVYRSVDRELPRAVTETVAGSVERSLNQTFEPALERSLHRSLAGPDLDNFEGHLLAALLCGGVPVGLDAHATATVVRDQDYELAVRIVPEPTGGSGPDPAAGAASARLRIRGGKDSPSVVFQVSVDSNARSFRQDAKSLTVTQDTPGELRFPLRLGDQAPESPWLWVRVAQHDRTIQNLELTLTVTDMPA